MKFILDKDTLRIQYEDEDDEIINSGSVNYYEAEVEYDESWEDLAIKAVLIKSGEVEGNQIAVINNKIFLDREKHGRFKIGFIGYTLENEQKIYQVSTNLESFRLQKGAGSIEVVEGDIPTPTEWEIYVAKIQEFIREGQAVVNEANNLDVELQDNILTITKKDGTQISSNVKGEDYTITEEDYKEIEGNVKTDIQPILENIEDIANQAEVIAKGKSSSVVTDTWAEMEQWLKDIANKGTHKIGDNLYIKAKYKDETMTERQPDYWIAEVLEEPNEKGYYYEISELEADKPDLEAYTKKEQFITLSQEAYDKLETKSANTYYYIPEQEE